MAETGGLGLRERNVAQGVNVSNAASVREYEIVQTERFWNDERLYVDGDSYFDALIEDIHRAKFSVLLESYIFEDDSLGQRIIEALLDARGRGVDVRVLIDGVGSANFIGRSLNGVLTDGLNFRVFHPLPWQILPKFGLPRRYGMRGILSFFSYLNSRNHRKMAVIDNHIAFVGSLNVSDVHLKEVLDEHAWHDLGVRVEGDAVDILGLVFEKSWNKSWLQSSHHILRPSRTVGRFSRIPDSESIVRNDSRLARHRAFNQRLHAIRSARSRVWISNAYFVPSGQLLRALMSAAKAGTDVRILLPRISDVHFMPWVARVFYESLIKYGVKVYEYSPRVLHAKAMLLDHSAWIGSTNLNHRSLLHDTELDIVVFDSDVIDSLEKAFLEDFGLSREIDSLSLQGESVFHRLFAQILLYFRHML